MNTISIAELEQAINFWREQHPSRGEEKALSPEVNKLGTLYAMMIFNNVQQATLDEDTAPLVAAWRGALPLFSAA